MTAPTKTKPRGPRKGGRPAGPRKPKGAAKANPAKRPTNISDAALREAYATLNRPARTLPESWWLDEVAENMSAWIKARGKANLKRRFSGRR